ncbi:MAG: hypothetical protein GDA38_00625 [Hormoscilla sp. SP12CHS1]|nr:hypothetical protein [Hormoscilla sp. SP12CHS1]
MFIAPDMLPTLDYFGLRFGDRLPDYLPFLDKKYFDNLDILPVTVLTTNNIDNQQGQSG